MGREGAIAAEGRTAESYMRLRADMLRDAAGSVHSLLAAATAARESVEALYLTPLDRVRVAASLTGLGVAAASLATGAPLYIVAPRVASNIVSLVRAGRRVKATTVSVPLRLALEEIFLAQV